MQIDAWRRLSAAAEKNFDTSRWAALLSG